jgi:hypothetical protein
MACGGQKRRQPGLKKRRACEAWAEAWLRGRRKVAWEIRGRWLASLGPLCSLVSTDERDNIHPIHHDRGLCRRRWLDTMRIV